MPPLCPACREPVEGRGLCPACWSNLSFITRPYCERLGIPFVYDPGPGGVPIAGAALKRVKPTVQEVGLSRSERAANVQGAFRVPADSKAAVAGRRLILIDDVLTSGATVDGCARALLRAGAANVDVLIFARVADPVRTSI